MIREATCFKNSAAKKNNNTLPRCHFRGFLDAGDAGHTFPKGGRFAQQQARHEPPPHWQLLFQLVTQGQSLAHTVIGLKVPRFFSDGKTPKSCRVLQISAEKKKSSNGEGLIRIVHIYST